MSGLFDEDYNRYQKMNPRQDLRNCQPCKDKLLAGMEAARFTGKIVVILPIRDEGKEALLTVQRLRASKAPGTDLQFFIVDDGSTDGCCKSFHGKHDDITFMTAPTDSGVSRQVGQGIIRSLAVQEHPDARGYYSIDGHEDITQHGMEQLVLDSERVGGIVMARSTNLAKGGCNVGVGCNFGITGAGQTMRMKGTWIRDKKPDKTGLIPVKLLGGADYAWTPEVWNTINGTRESHGLYGMFDIDLSIASYFCGLPVYCNGNVKAAHLYRRKRPYNMSGRWRWWAYVECFRSMFRPEIFTQHFEPSARFIQNKLKDPMILWLLNCPRVTAMQAEFETRKKRTDMEVLKWMGIA